MDTVLFIGSGISTWSGVPSWPRLIEELATYIERHGLKPDVVRAEAERGDLLQAASYGFDKLTKQQICKFIRDTCRYGVAEPHDVHKKIVSFGARCFITTNYDNLIEKALERWQPDRFIRPPITNRHLTETAEIVHARAIDFIFKPHGDASDSDSIILTREQYRQLLPQGERHSALESLKILLATRPVVYLGFSLRDPDFMYVRDLLANIYNGTTLDHYALMADVSEPERDYWSRNYGIHLVSYATTIRHDRSKDHSALLTLLDSLLKPSPVDPLTGAESTDCESSRPDIVLSLARHSARLLRAQRVDPEFNVRVNAERVGPAATGMFFQHDRFEHWSVDKFLDDGPQQALLVGSPGVGKTYALRQAARRLAQKLHETCLSETFDETAVIIPILVDLKLYRGNITELINQTLPPRLPLGEVVRRFRAKIFFDSFNEMPREYIESGAYEGDFGQFVETIGSTSLVIGSRTTDGLSKFGFPSYRLDQLDSEVVATALRKMNIKIPGHFDEEIRRLLGKPFFFQLVASGAASLQKDAHPRDIFQSYFNNLRDAFTKRFGQTFDIEESLSVAAYNAINRGHEAYPRADLIQVLNEGIQAAKLGDIGALDIVNWLVSASVLVPHIGSRIAFVHQSVTEYLAAKQLTRLYLAAPHILKDSMAITRWDQAVFLTLSFLPEQRAKDFFESIINADLMLALNAVKYLEVDRDDAVSRILGRILERVTESTSLEFEFWTRIAFLIESGLPVSDVHEPQLRALMKRRNIIGGAAANLIVRMRGAEVKDEMFRQLLEARSDYNYCINGIARAIQPLITEADVEKILELADSISDEVTPESDDEVNHGFIGGAAELLKGIDIEIIKESFYGIDKLRQMPEIRARILCDILQDCRATGALELAGDLLLLGIKDAPTAIYFIVNFGEPDLKRALTSFGGRHLDVLISMVNDPKGAAWGASGALRCLCSFRPDLAEIVLERASHLTGIGKALLLHCASSENETAIFDALGELVQMNAAELGHQATHLMDKLKLNWVGHEALFVRMLKLRNADLAINMGESIQHRESVLGELDVGPIEWYLDWLMTESDMGKRFKLQNILPEILMRHGGNKVSAALVSECNKSDTKYRSIIAHAFLPYHGKLSTDNFSSDVISFLLSDLGHTEIYPFRGHILGLTATEEFVEERLLPLLSEAKDRMLTNLRKVLRQAGARHGRRYVFE